MEIFLKTGFGVSLAPAARTSENAGKLVRRFPFVLSCCPACGHYTAAIHTGSFLRRLGRQDSQRSRLLELVLKCAVPSKENRRLMTEETIMRLLLWGLAAVALFATEPGKRLQQKAVSKFKKIRGGGDEEKAESNGEQENVEVGANGKPSKKEEESNKKSESGNGKRKLRAVSNDETEKDESEKKEKEKETGSSMFEFPIPIADTGTGIFPAQVKAITLMRWIRKHLEKIQKGGWG